MMKFTSLSLIVAATASLAGGAKPDGMDVVDYCPVGTRRTPWASLYTDHAAAATVLGYMEGTWNYELPYYNLIEDMWHSGMPPTHQTAATTLGYDAEDKWDCCVNHYYSYTWDELVTLQPEAKAAFEVFGWNQTISDSGDYPPHWNEAYWADLTDEEKEAAAVLCYTQEMWDVVSLTAGRRRRRELLRRGRLLRSLA